MSKHTKAFSMLELIFVIVILGIVASVGSSVIVKVYESYIVQRAVHNASLKTELAVTQLANRLAYRIDSSVVARVPGAAGFAVPNDIISLRNITPAQANTHRVLEWIGYDNDGFSTQLNTPGWSGFVDLNNVGTGFGRIVSTGSNLAAETPILNNLFPNMRNPAIVFMTPLYQNGTLGTLNYDVNCLYNTAGNGCIFPVTFNNPNTLIFTGGGNRVLTNMVYAEFYQLAGSAYAVVPLATPQNGNDIVATTNVNGTPAGLTINGTPVWDLTLFYDYQPWEGESYINGSSSILLRKVSVFRFTQELNSVRVKICTIETIGTQDISICKEKAVIR